MDAITHRNLQELCRACLKTLENNSDGITDNNNLLLPNLCQLFLCFTTMDVTKELAKFPKLLCQLCLNRLLDYDAFRKLTLKSTETLHQMLLRETIPTHAEQGRSTTMCTDDCDEILVKTENMSDEEDEIVPAVIIPENAVDQEESWVKREEQLSNQETASPMQETQEAEARDNKHDKPNVKEEDDDNRLLLPELADMGLNIKPEPLFEATDTQFNEDSINHDDSFSQEDQASFEMNPNEDGDENADNNNDNDADDNDNDAQGMVFNATNGNVSKNGQTLFRMLDGPPVHPDTRQIFFCNTCNKKFYKQLYLDAHIKGIHLGEKEPFHCIMCPLTFVSYSKLYLHRKSKHTKEKKTENEQNQRPKPQLKTSSDNKYLCELCQGTYSSRKAITEHIKRHKQIKEYVCQFCGVAKVTRTELNTHMRVHFRDMEKFPCPRCPQVFNHRNAISRHVKVVHEGERRYSCDYCSKKFSTRNSKVCHERLHTGEKPFTCAMCDKSFAQSESLKSHMKSHDKSLCKHICSYCSRRFITLKNLTDHEKRHTSDKPHICVVCSKGFHISEDLDKHYANCHADGKESISKKRRAAKKLLEPTSSSQSQHSK
ncbi:zinc finger protein 468 [Musca domestica]|uniref:Zinc finger protein 468 n=1 Tax=Musca domestica TaxID=7370 RepID=A0A9J7DB17_MUSDO|nr:zinc finger protein 468 [Musca domestica]